MEIIKLILKYIKLILTTLICLLSLLVQKHSFFLIRIDSTSVLATLKPTLSREWCSQNASEEKEKGGEKQDNNFISFFHIQIILYTLLFIINEKLITMGLLQVSLG